MKDHIDTLLKSEDLKEISSDLVEMVLDDHLADGILKEIPVVRSLVAAKNIYSSFTDRIFIKKAMTVLMEIGDVDWKQRVELVNGLDDEDEKGADKIIMAIDKLETTKKCKVYGRLCKLRALDKIGIEDFLRATKVIQDAFLDDLYLIREFNKDDRKEIWEGDYYPLIALGLIFQEPSDQAPIERLSQTNEYDPEFSGGEITFNYMLSGAGEIIRKHYHELFLDR